MTIMDVFRKLFRIYGPRFSPVYNADSEIRNTAEVTFENASECSFPRKSFHPADSSIKAIIEANEIAIEALSNIDSKSHGNHYSRHLDKRLPRTESGKPSAPTRFEIRPQLTQIIDRNCLHVKLRWTMMQSERKGSHVGSKLSKFISRILLTKKDSSISISGIKSIMLLLLLRHLYKTLRIRCNTIFSYMLRY
jgi:hypothetical protein